jgi:hypothetical protein
MAGLNSVLINRLLEKTNLDTIANTYHLDLIYRAIGERYAPVDLRTAACTPKASQEATGGSSQPCQYHCQPDWLG